MNKLLMCSLTLVVATLNLAAPAVQADELFPDKKLEAVVRKYVFEKRNNDEPLVEEDVVDISTIEGKGQGIKDLTGLEKCRSLALLDLEDNEIADIGAIAELTNIQSLNLAGNQIKDIAPIAGLTKLQYVHVADNQISDIKSLAKLENLRSLYLSNNQVKDLKPLAELAKIWSLYVDGNQVENLEPLAGLKWLDSLDARGNKISDLGPLKGLTEWKYLRLENNQVTDLGVLIEMGKKDKEDSQRFAYFWNVYLTGNPLSEEAQKTQLEELRKVAKSVAFEPKADESE